MPCRDYEDDYSTSDDVETYKKMRDKLARIACKAMDELERIDPTNELFKDKESGPWYTQHKIDDAKAKEAVQLLRALDWEARAAREAKAAALSKLTPEDKKALGIN